MRPARRSTNSNVDLNNFTKPIEKIIEELIEHLDSKCATSVTTRVESIRNFLFRIRCSFNKSSRSTINKLVTITEDEQINIESQIELNCEPISISLLYSIIQSESSQIRLLSLQTILLLTHLKSYALKFHQLNINLYIIRLIDLDLSWDETSLSLEYVRLLAQLWPAHVDKSIVYCLMSVLEDAKYKLNNLVLETLLEIICKRPGLACECMVFNELITYVLNVCTDNEFAIELIMQTLVRVSDDGEYRSQIPLYDLLSNLISPLIDTVYVPFTYGPYYMQPKLQHHLNQNYSILDNNDSSSSEPKIEAIITASFTALSSLMSSYNGIMCFLVNNGQLLCDLLSPLSWYLSANKRDSNNRQTLAEQFTSTSLSESSENITNRKNSNPKEIQAKQRELFILNGLIGFLYKLFRIEEISIKKLVTKAFRCMGRTMSVGSSSQQNNYYGYDLAEDDFVNQECDSLFNSYENYSVQSNMNNIQNDYDFNMHSTSPNLALCHRSLLIKTFIEARLFESLLDLYFGLPVSFLENCSILSLNQHSQSTQNNNNNLLYQYEILSLKCLNLFAELYYMVNMLLPNEYCIDDLDPDSNKWPFTNSKSIYNEMKKLSLIGYLKNLNYSEREKEVLIYVTDLNTKKESIRRGEMIQSDEISTLSFFGQQFLANSGHLSSKKYQMELEILNSNLPVTNTKKDITQPNNDEYFKSIFNMVSSLIINEDSNVKEKKEIKSRLIDIEKKLEDQFEITQVLQWDMNLTTMNQYHPQPAQQWNWLEIIKLFEEFLLESSSLYPRFTPTQDSKFLFKYKRKLFTENQKLIKLIKRLFEFFTLPDPTTPNHSMTQVQSTPTLTTQLSYSPRIHHSSSRISQTSYQLQTPNTSISLNDQLACIGCYLIDFCLLEMSIEQLTQNRFTSIVSFLLIQFVQSIKHYLCNEFPISQTMPMQNRNRLSQNSATSVKSISKDSVMAYYILFLGHLTSHQKGDLLLEHFKMHELIIKIIEFYRDVAFIKLVVSTFNFYTSPKSRLVLETSLSCQSPKTNQANYNELKVYIIKLVLNLFRAHNSKFEAFYVQILLKSMFTALTDDDFEDNSPVAKYSNEQVLELSLNAVEYLFNLRPDFVDRLLVWDTDNLVKGVDELITKSQRLLKSRLIRIKLEFLSYRLKMSDSSLAKFEKVEVEALLKKWYATKQDLKYFQLIERHLFDANSINANYVSEIDDRVEYHRNYKTRFSIDENPSSSSNCEETTKDYTAETNVKLYRRINDPNRNITQFQASLAQIYLPFHINTALIRYSHFINANLSFNEYFDEKTAKHLQLIKASVQDANINAMKLKSALWSICCLCICENGFKFVSKINEKYKIFVNLFEFVCYFVKLAEDHPNLSIRATCFLCSNLMSKSCTGANLLGKLGWHTFQSNLFTPTRAFHSNLTSLSAEQQDLTLASSIDIAVAIYNLNRSKVNGIQMKTVHKYFVSEFTKYELDFLHEVNRNELSSKSDVDFIREYNRDKIGSVYFAENLTVPIRGTLMSPVDDFKATLSQRQHVLLLSQSEEVAEFLGDCKLDNCLYCCYLKKNSACENSEFNEKRKIAFELMNKFILMINVDKSKMIELKNLRKFYPGVFNFCFFYLVSVKYLSCHRIKFHVRRYFQELFYDI